MFDPINVDCITDDPKELRELAEAFADLASYARWRAAAIESRRAGDIAKAGRREQTAELFYRALPEWARW